MVESTEEATNKIEAEEEPTSNTIQNQSEAIDVTDRLATDDMSFTSPNEEADNPASQAIN